MSDDTEGPKPWDIDQFRGVRRHIERKDDWEKEAELVLDASYRTEQITGKVTPKYDTEGPSLFWLSLKTAILTVLTLGFYRFWMVTSLRRHYWNSIRIQGDPLEYTGTGLEKILGFLVGLKILQPCYQLPHLNASRVALTPLPMIQSRVVVAAVDALGRGGA